MGTTRAPAPGYPLARADVAERERQEEGPDHDALGVWNEDCGGRNAGSGRWKLEEGDVRGFYLSQEDLELLQLEEENVFNSWVNLCNADPSFLPRVAAEYSVCVFPPSNRLLRSPSPISSATVVLDKGEEEEQVFGTHPVMS